VSYNGNTVNKYEKYDVDEKWYQFSAEEHTTKVTVSVLPVAEEQELKGSSSTRQPYWNGTPSTEATYNFTSSPPSIPENFVFELDGLKLTVRVDNVTDRNTKAIFFEVWRVNATSGAATAYYKGANVPINSTTKSAAVIFALNAGESYRVRCKGLSERISGSIIAGEYTAFSAIIKTVPVAPTMIVNLKATSSTSIYVSWASSSTADTYDLEYATKKAYLGTDKSQIVSGIEQYWYDLIGLDSDGAEYFMRVRAVNDQGESGWTKTVSIILGKAPEAPTTWSSTTTAIVGEKLVLYWTHNTQDNSRQRKAEIEIDTGSAPYVIEIDDTWNDESEDEEDVTHYEINTSQYPDGTEFRWKVRTKGILDVWSPWSIQRTVDIYAPATLSLYTPDELKRFPLKINSSSGPTNQETMGYHISIVANETYETTDNLGNFKMVNKGDAVYSKYFDVSDNNFELVLSAGDVNLDNNISYTVLGSVSKDSGLTAEDSCEFKVAWEEDPYEPNVSIGINTEDYSAYIQPFCTTRTGAISEDVTLAVYRREPDGKFTEIMSGIENSNNTYITDPHPALDYARYRIVATSKTTGAVSYYDPPGVPVGCKSIILQWDEEWTDFNTVDGWITERPWTGSMLKLHYNIDISEQAQPDVVFVEYIGREHPVSYFGTQLGQTATWNTVIPKYDTDTLYALRRLSVWMGNVYVREPSGTGYWAKVEVSYNRNHLDLTIPVTLNITRVEGGV
jgi:hypothetical protein